VAKLEQACGLRGVSKIVCELAALGGVFCIAGDVLGGLQEAEDLDCIERAVGAAARPLECRAEE